LERVEALYFPKDVHEDGVREEDVSMHDGPWRSVPSPSKKLSQATARTRAVVKDVIVQTTDPLAAPHTVKKKGGKTSDVVTPALDRTKVEKENEAPPSTGRASKLRAQEQLEKAKEDILLYQKEMKRRGGVTHGRKRQSDEAESDGMTSNDQENLKEVSRPAKRAKSTLAGPAVSEQVPVQYRMMVSGDERWKGAHKKEDEDRVSRLTNRCSHDITDRPRRKPSAPLESN